MQVEIWSDVVCPWCYIGKRRFEAALAGYAHRDEIDVVWRSFELDPGAPRHRDGDPLDRLAAKYGMTRGAALEAQVHVTETAAGVGLDFHLDTAQSGNSFDAHRLLHLAGELGLQDRLKERLLAAYFVEGEAIGETDTLVRLAADVGIDGDKAREVLDSGRFAEEVRADEQTAVDFGITGVPCFVIDRTYAISGAQPVAVFERALERAWDDTHPLTFVDAPGDGEACEGDTCAI